MTTGMQLENILNTSQDYLSTQKEIEELLKEAYFNLAKAKYGQVNGRLGPTSYNMDMKATKTIQITGSEGGDYSFELQTGKIEEEQVDPIRWFGAMPSQSLKEAQKGFSSALDKVISLAKLASQLRSETQ
eukprot:TRINITY_DN751_c0_g1_i1.p3 TRINITY_DN751_c0_g1~~TRINITY_DN751_c0_g1_i1.p3  ORF type:complete len:130 (+),score=21.59 TRINITY_DN751_c0_g1_i1:356-745(+)